MSSREHELEIEPPMQIMDDENGRVTLKYEQTSWSQGIKCASVSPVVSRPVLEEIISFRDLII